MIRLRLSRASGRAHRLVVALASIALALPASAARAQPSSKEAAPTEYKRHMDIGIKLYKAGDFEAALAESTPRTAPRPRPARW